ncbi:hypothetical protein Tco_1267874, partial [Tanacetum coccineum]
DPLRSVLTSPVSQGIPPAITCRHSSTQISTMTSAALGQSSNLSAQLDPQLARAMSCRTGGAFRGSGVGQHPAAEVHDYGR